MDQHNAPQAALITRLNPVITYVTAAYKCYKKFDNLSFDPDRQQMIS